MAVVTAAVPDGQGVVVGAESDGGGGRILAPDGNDAVTANMGIDFVGVQTLQMFDNQIVCKLLVAGGLRMFMKQMPYLFVVCHIIHSFNGELH